MIKANRVGDVGGWFEEFAFVEDGAGTDQGDQVGALTARHWAWAASMSL